MPFPALHSRSFRSFSAAALSLVLLLLTVSLPYTIRPLSKESSYAKGQPTHAQSSSQDEEQMPWNDMTEEKAAEGSNSLNEEYLHEHHPGMDAGSLGRNRYLSDRGDPSCLSYDGELLVPPPNPL